MQIFIKNRINQKIVTLNNVEHSDTINDIKKKIQDKQGTPTGQQGLMSEAGTPCGEGDRELWEYNIQDSSTLELYFLLCVPVPVLSYLSQSNNHHQGEKAEVEEDENDDDDHDDFQCSLFNFPGNSLLMGATVSSLKRDVYDPELHQSQIEEMFCHELVDLMSLDSDENDSLDGSSRKIDDDDYMDNEIKCLEAVNDFLGASERTGVSVNSCVKDSDDDEESDPRPMPPTSRWQQFSNAMSGTVLTMTSRINSMQEEEVSYNINDSSRENEADPVVWYPPMAVSRLL